MTERWGLLEELCGKVFKYIEKLGAASIEGTYGTEGLTLGGEVFEEKCGQNRQSVKTCFSWVCIFRRRNKRGVKLSSFGSRDFFVSFLKDMLNLAEEFVIT